MKSESMIKTIVIIALIVVGVYFAWDWFLRDFLIQVQMTIFGREVVPMSFGMATPPPSSLQP
jgi:hypothetical protein